MTHKLITDPAMLAMWIRQELAIEEPAEGAVKALIDVYVRLPEWIQGAVEFHPRAKWKDYPGFTVKFVNGNKKAGLSVVVDRMMPVRHFEVANWVGDQLGLEEEKVPQPEEDDFDTYQEGDPIKHYWISGNKDVPENHRKVDLEETVLADIETICEKYREYIIVV